MKELSVAVVVLLDGSCFVIKAGATETIASFHSALELYAPTYALLQWHFIMSVTFFFLFLPFTCDKVLIKDPLRPGSTLNYHPGEGLRGAFMSVVLKPEDAFYHCTLSESFVCGCFIDGVIWMLWCALLLLSLTVSRTTCLSVTLMKATSWRLWGNSCGHRAARKCRASNCPRKQPVCEGRKKEKTATWQPNSWRFRSEVKQRIVIGILRSLFCLRSLQSVSGKQVPAQKQHCLWWKLTST